MMDRNMNTNTRGSSASQDHCEDWVVGMVYVPWQTFGKTYDPKKALMAGTIFPELDKPFTGRCKGGRKR